MKEIIKRFVLIGVWIGCIYGGLLLFRSVYMLLFTLKIGQYTLTSLQVVGVLLASSCGALCVTYVLPHKSKRTDWLKNVVWVVGQSVVVFVWSELCRWWHNSVVGSVFHANDLAHIHTAQTIQTDPFLLIGFAIIIVCIAPVVEECLFRLLFDKLVMNQRFRVVGSLISSVAFSLIHTSQHMITTIFYFGVGILLYSAYSRRGSVWESIGVHALFNMYILYQFKDVLL